MLKVENKIGILINWPREFDMYSQLINHIPSKKIRIIVNDIKGFDKERFRNFDQIKKILISKKIYNFELFSNIYKKKKYKIILSTGESCTHKLSLYSIFRWTYGQTAGRFIEWSNLSRLFKKLFKRPFSAEGKYSSPFARWFPERNISEISVKYPQGMDLNYIYPDISWKKYFDVFFTHGHSDSKMIKNKFPTKEIFIIGYPRYEKLKKFHFTKKQKKDFINIDNFNKNKKNILWLPTYFKYKEIYGENIFKWLEKIRYLTHKYNIIIRPHPKTLQTSPNLINYLKKENFIIDTRQDRKLGELINFSNLVMCDYGGPIFSSLYLEKNIILLNYLKNSRFVKEKINSNSFDIEVRKFLTNCDLDLDKKIFNKIIENEIKFLNKKKIMKIKNYYYGEDKYFNSISKTSKYLINKLAN